MTSRRLEESMGAVQMGLVRMLKGFQSKVLPPLSPKVVTEEEVNQMVTYRRMSGWRASCCLPRRVTAAPWHSQHVRESLLTM